MPDYDYLYVEDAGLGQIGWIGVIGENGRPAVVFIRLLVRDGVIAEIETIVRREQPRLYDPANMAEPRAKAFRRARSCGMHVARRAGRDRPSFFDGLVQVDGDMIPASDDCIRIENRNPDRTRSRCESSGGVGKRAHLPARCPRAGQHGLLLVHGRHSRSAGRRRGRIARARDACRRLRSLCSQTLRTGARSARSVPAYHQVPNERPHR